MAIGRRRRFDFNNQKPPFNDIRVRQALSLAIDQESIAESYMQGWGDASPQGPTGANVLGYVVPFAEWPEETKQYYRYDPEEAERLLDEAGYPRGADGVRFSTVYEHYEFFDLGYYQIAMDLPPADWHRRRDPGKYSRGIYREVLESYLPRSPLGGMGRRVYQSPRPGLCILVEEWVASPEQQRPRIRRVLRKRAGRYYDRGAAGVGAEGQPACHRASCGRSGAPRAPLFGATQPWLKGYNGETELGPTGRTAVFQYLWIDQDLKRELGF